MSTEKILLIILRIKLNFLVVNDTAERAVKLSQDLLSTAKKEENFQHNLQVVENIRHMKPDQRRPKAKATGYFKELATI